MELLAYIKELILLNDCVIVPGFGGFITTYKPAGLQSSRFTPPGKSVSFNRKLNFNDGLFINYIAEKEGLNYVVAGRKADLLVQELNYRLTEGEEISIPGIGTLQYNDQENLIFTPKPEGNLNLDAFGLSAFTYESLFARNHVQKPIPPQKRDVNQVMFQKRSLKKVLVAVPLLFALAVIPLKNNTVNLQQSNLVSLPDMITLSEPLPQPVTETNQELTEEVEAEQAVLEDHRYFMIGGSFRSEDNADTFISMMNDQGFDAKNIGFIKGLHYIALDSFDSLEEAKTARNDFKLKSPDSDVWIYVKE
ncbi:SPOR domain-containing protein [Gaoshiqia sp. Z1-71]|uniref:HU domain-containing protein n=1 Tax=Gaoshiqia hydrogeniformans TaxID=3290090 RepID=UPI003BF8305D